MSGFGKYFPPSAKAILTQCVCYVHNYTCGDAQISNSIGIFEEWLVSLICNKILNKYTVL